MEHRQHGRGVAAAGPGAKLGVELGEQGLTADEELAQAFDALIAARGYSNRSEAVRDILRSQIEASRLAREDAPHCIANLSYVFNHHERELAERVTHADIMGAVEQAVPGGMLRSAVLFDVYRPKALRAGEEAPAGGLAPGEKSLAVRLTLMSDEGSLADTQIEQTVQAVLAELQERVAARLR